MSYESPHSPKEHGEINPCPPDNKDTGTIINASFPIGGEMNIPNQGSQPQSPWESRKWGEERTEQARGLKGEAITNEVEIAHAKRNHHCEGEY